MSGLSAVIARVGEIETQIVSLHPSARTAAAEATAAADQTAATTATTFAGVLEAASASAVTPEGVADPASALADVLAGRTPAGESTPTPDMALLSALQTLFTAGASGATTDATGSRTSPRTIAETIG